MESPIKLNPAAAEAMTKQARRGWSLVAGFAAGIAAFALLLIMTGQEYGERSIWVDGAIVAIGVLVWWFNGSDNRRASALGDKALITSDRMQDMLVAAAVVAGLILASGWFLGFEPGIPLVLAASGMFGYYAYRRVLKAQ